MDPLLPLPLGVGTAVVALLGIMAGLTTTVAGVGGGLVLTLALAPLIGPHAALAVAALPLVFGNGHRALLFRKHVNTRVVGFAAVGIIPGVAVGALAVGALPARGVYGLLFIAVALAVARELGWVRFRPGRGLLIPGGAAFGFMSGSAGAGGLLVGPLFLAAGLRADAFVASIAAVGVIVNTARVISYGAAGFMTASLLPAAVVITLGLVIGNDLGRRLRPRIKPSVLHAMTWVVIAVCIALAVAGLR